MWRWGKVCVGRCEPVMVEAVEVGSREDGEPVERRRRRRRSTGCGLNSCTLLGACSLTAAAGPWAALQTLTGYWNWAVCPQRSCSEGRDVCVCVTRRGV